MRILVVHPNQQHSYQLASALAKKEWLAKYVTTVYYRPWSLTKFVTFFLRGKFKRKAMLRSCNTIPTFHIKQFCEAWGLLKLCTMHIPILKGLYRKVKYLTIDRFAQRVASYAIKQKVDAVVCYDDCSAVLFSLLKEKAPDILRIMDMSAANLLYMRTVYEKDFSLQPQYAELLKNERQVVWHPDNIKRTQTELALTDYFLVPSKFVERSLAYSGISKERMKLCPYGVDTKQFVQTSKKPLSLPLSRPIHFIYVGGVKELKGISYLLEAIEQLPACQAKLTIVGQIKADQVDLSRYHKRVHFTGPILHEQVAELLQSADVYVFPSLGEGLSLSTLEAASCGLPLIVSQNSGVNDYMQEGKEGFVIPIQSTKALVEKMQWFITNPEKIQIMGQNARDLAKRYTWENYHQRVQQVFEQIMNESAKEFT